MSHFLSFRSFLTRLTESPESFSVLDEAGLSRVMDHLNKRSVGIVTAFRGSCSSGINPKQLLDQNRQRNQQLQDEIRRNGYGYLRLRGTWIENEGTPNECPVKEESFLVVGETSDDQDALRNFVVDMGTKWNQDAVIYKPWDSSTANLIFKNDPATLVPIGTFTVDPKKIGTMYSIFKGRKFVFHSLSGS